MKQPLALIIVDALDIASLDFRQTLDSAGYLTELITCDQVSLPQIGRIQPKVIFLHLSFSNVAQVGFLKDFQNNDDIKDIPVIALVPGEKMANDLYSLASVVLVRPISRESLIGLLSSLDYVDTFVDKTPWDTTTGLYTSTFFLASLNQVLERSKLIQEREFIVFSINLDQLLKYERKFGKEYRQHLLHGAAKVLKKVLRPADIVARFEPNIFMVLIDHAVDRYVPVSIADRMQFEFDEFLVNEGLKNRIKIEIGVIYGTPQYKSANDVLSDARLTLRMAKQSAHNGYEIIERTKSPTQPTGIRSLAGV